ncbi:MAG: oligosaccharide flippase family protein [Gemmatimonadaceae bacterium]
MVGFAEFFLMTSPLSGARGMLRRARASRFVRDVVLLSGSTAVGQALVALATPVLTRLYTPAEFGVFGIFLSAVSVASIGVTLQFDVAVPGARDDDEGRALVVACLVLTIPMTLLLTALLWLASSQVWSGLDAIGTMGVVLLMPALAGFGATSTLRYWLVRRKRFDRLGLVAVGQGASRAIVPMLLAATTAGWAGIAAGEVAGRWFGLSTMLRAALPDLRMAFASGWPGRARVAVRRYASFVGTVLPSSLADVLVISLPLPLLSSAYGASAAGVFLLVQRLVSIPASLVGASVADVFHADASILFRTTPARLPAAVGGVAGHLFRMGAVFLLPLALVAPWGAEIVFGQEWSAAGAALAILTPAALANLVVMPVSRVLFVVRRNELKIVYDVLALVLLIGGLALARRLRLPLLGAIGALSAAQCLSYGVYYFLIRYATLHPRAESV